jgi:hypothetical protein
VTLARCRSPFTRYSTTPSIKWFVVWSPLFTTVTTNAHQARQETDLFKKFTTKIQSIIDGLEGKGEGKESQNQSKNQDIDKHVEENFGSIKDASILLQEIKDTRDELNILKAVLMHQNKVWNEIHETESETAELKGPAYMINEIEEMDKQAQRVQNAVGIPDWKDTIDVS